MLEFRLKKVEKQLLFLLAEVSSVDDFSKDRGKTVLSR